MNRQRRAVLASLGTAMLFGVVAAAAPARAAAIRCDDTVGAAVSTELGIHRPPRLDRPTVVDTAFRIVELTDIDVRKGHFQFQAYVDFAWCDRRLTFDPKEMGSELRAFVGADALKKQGEIWSPDLAMVNEVSGIQVRKRELTIRSDGRVRLRGLFSAHLAANFDLRRFPFDSQILPIQVESFAWSEDTVTFRTIPEGIGVRQDFELAEWRVGDVTSEMMSVARAMGDKSFARLEIHIAIERRAGFYLWKAVLPLFLIVGLSWTVFWIPDGLSGRIRLSATVILTIVAYQFAMAADLPKVAYVTLFSAFTTVSFVSVALTVLVNIIVFYRQDQGSETAVSRSDRVSRWLVPVIYLLSVAAVAMFYLG
ncbi:MAG: hypothetical protein JRH16_14665 [Deltaproteobacteria bacterium]|nr:hypothetical protein [Deltaproteobacteria bacterium]MBW2421303.1 hypothetical protein [Deltaproteobacteria bacterium]